MASKNSANGPDVNGTEQQKTDLFQNLEKLIASAVSICRLDGSVQCQIGGLITVIEELQRLLRHSFAEIQRLERNIEEQNRNLEDQAHTFSNNITNLHYKVKAVQSSVETLKHESEEAQKSKEESNVDQQNSPNATDVEPPQMSLVDDESYGEESDGLHNIVQHAGNNPVTQTTSNTLTDIGDVERSSNNLEDNTLTETEGSSQPNEELSGADPGQAAGTDDNGADDAGADEATADEATTDETTADDAGADEATADEATADETTADDAGADEATVDEATADEATADKATTTPSHETSDTNLPDAVQETATSTSEERESALRSLRSTSKTSSQDELPRRNHRMKSKAGGVEADTNRTILSLRNHGRSPRAFPSQTSSHNTRPPKASLGEQPVKNAARHKATPPGKPARKTQPGPQIAPKRSLRTLSPSKLKALVKSPQRQRELNKAQRKAQQSRKSLPGRSARSPAKHNRPRLSTSPFTRNQVLNVSNGKANTGKTSFSKKEPKKATALQQPAPSEENLMDKYINLDFLLNANQLMSELVSDTRREEGTLDTASEVERRYIVDLAKLYRLRVRMADKCDGDLPVALIKGRESSLPKTGQVDRLLYTMTHAVAIKTKSANKHKLAAGNRRSMASPTKKRRV